MLVHQAAVIAGGGAVEVREFGDAARPGAPPQQVRHLRVTEIHGDKLVLDLLDLAVAGVAVREGVLAMQRLQQVASPHHDV